MSSFKDVPTRTFYTNDNILTLRESHHEHHINGNEPQQVSHDHPIDHNHERTDSFETPAGKKCSSNIPYSLITVISYYK